MSKPPLTSLTSRLAPWVLLAALPACRDGRATKVSEHQTVLRVNGVAISELEVALETRRGHGAEDSTESRDQILEGLVLQEAMAQQAAALGLERDEGYAERMARVEAQRSSQRRKELARLFYKREVLDKVSATDAEAKALFEQDKRRIQTELHVAQILTRDEAQALSALAELQAGRSFDEVAARNYPDLPVGMKPWDLGYLKWKNVPPEWQAPLGALAPGQTSGVIKGPGRRFWIVKLLDQRTNLELTFERTRADLLDVLKARKAEALRARLERELLGAARVEKPTPSALASPRRQPIELPSGHPAAPGAPPPGTEGGS